MKKFIAVGSVIIVAAVCLRSPVIKKENDKVSSVISKKSLQAQTNSGKVKTNPVSDFKPQEEEEVSFTELEREFRNLSLKDLDEKIAAIEKSEELRTFIFNANKGSLTPEESRSLVYLIRTKAVLSKLAAEKELGEVL